MPAERSLAILHVLRAPVGGLFRHVVDLSRAQAALGHRIGIIADAATGGARADDIFAQLAPHLALGLSRVPMSRHLGWTDVAAVAHVNRRIREARADVVHGHGAKGGAYARLAAPNGALRAYTPHGGSLHYRLGSPIGAFYLALEKILARRTDLFVFESAYGRDTFSAKVGAPRAAVRVVHNGVGPEDFEPVQPLADAADLLFVGELRMLKGVDVLIEAVAILARAGAPRTLTIVGDGPDRARFEAQRSSHGLDAWVRFTGALPARDAFARGQTLVVPSRAESLPYIVLEAAAAGMPIIATAVGGIPEIFGSPEGLVSPGDPAGLADAIARVSQNPGERAAHAARLRERVRAHFSVARMANQVLEAYGQAFCRAAAGEPAPLSLS